MAEESIGPRIAVVDDDASLCRSLARLLRASGMHAATYPSAEAYLDAGPQRGLDCLILDIELGGMSGIELCEHLRSGGVQAPVIILTAHEEPEWRTRAERAGCTAFFTKPEAGDVLLAAIHRSIRSGGGNA